MNLDHFSCPNDDCPDKGKTAGDNINLYVRYGRKQVRLLICKTCGKTFSELKGGPFWDSRLDWDTIEKIYRSLLSGQGIRATARDFNLSKNTVKRYLRILGKEFTVIQRFLCDRGGENLGSEVLLKELAEKFEIEITDPAYRQNHKRTVHAHA